MPFCLIAPFFSLGELDEATRAAKKSADEAKQFQVQLNDAQKVAKDRSDDVAKLRGQCGLLDIFSGCFLFIYHCHDHTRPVYTFDGVKHHSMLSHVRSCYNPALPFIPLMLTWSAYDGV